MWSSFDPISQADEVAACCREEPWFLGWFRQTARNGVIPKDRLLPEEMLPVLGCLAVLKPEAGARVAVRLWGERLAILAGGDLTGSDLERHRSFRVLAVAARSVCLGRVAFAETLSAWENGVPAAWVLVPIEDGRVLALARWDAASAGGPALRRIDQSREMRGSTPLSPGRRM